MTKSLNSYVTKDKSIDVSIYDKRISLVIVLHLCILACKNMLANTSDFFMSINSFLNTAILIFFLGIYVYAVFNAKLLVRINRASYIVLVLIVAFIGFSCMADPKLFVSDVFPYDYVKSQFRTFIIYSLPLFLAFSALRNTDHLLKLLFKATPILFAFSTFAFFMSTISFSELNEYSMAYGNALMLVAGLLLFKYRDNGKLSTLLAFLMTVFYIVISGSRGPVLCIAVLTLVALLTSKSGMGKMVWIGVVIVAGFALIFWYSDILNLIMRLMEALGLSSRTLNFLIDGSITYDSGRGEIYDNLIKEINKSPLLGLGAFGGHSAVGLPHSTYLDIFANFGYVFGSAFIVIIFCQIYKILRREKGSSLGKIFLMFATIVVVRGFFGGSLWTEKELWMLFGIMINYNKYDKKASIKG